MQKSESLSAFHADGAAGGPVRLTRENFRTLVLSSLGGALEYFDFTIYIYFATAISGLFFPSSEPEWIRQLLAFSVFALGWLVRPIGGTVFAHFGDRIGRKGMFMLSIAMMAVPTFLIGLLPTYSSIGVLAPILLILLRLVQGCAVAGEVSGSVIFVAEHAPRGRVGTSCAGLFALLYVGLFLGSLSGLINSRYVDHAAQLAWGWRLPFIVGGLLGLFAVYMRRQLRETPLFEDIREERRHAQTLPVVEAFRHHWQALVFILILSGVISAEITAVFQFLQTPLQSVYKFPKDVVYQANTSAIVVLAICGGLWGYLGDRIGLARAFALGAVLSLIATWWFFHALDDLPADGAGLTWRYMLLAVPASFVCVAPALGALAFPTRVRYSGFALPYNVGAAIFAGLIPVFLTWAGHNWGRTSAMYLVLVGAVLGLVAAAWAPRILASAERAR